MERLSEQNSQVLTDDTGEIPESEKTQIEEQSRTQSQSVQSIAAPVPGRHIEMIYENKINTEYDEYYNDDDDDDFPTDMVFHIYSGIIFHFYFYRFVTDLIQVHKLLYQLKFSTTKVFPLFSTLINQQWVLHFWILPIQILLLNLR